MFLTPLTFQRKAFNAFAFTAQEIFQETSFTDRQQKKAQIAGAPVKHYFEEY